jgi:hypothetical protein
MVLGQVCSGGGIRPPPLGKDNMGRAYTALTDGGDAATSEYQEISLATPRTSLARLLALQPIVGAAVPPDHTAAQVSARLAFHLSLP